MNEIRQIIIIIIFASLLMLGIIIWSKPPSPLSPHDTDELQEGEAILMKGINYQEMKESHLLFRIIADRGLFSLDSGQGSIKNTHAEIFMQEGGIFTIDGKKGKISEGGNTIFLEDGVIGKMDDGTEILTDSIYFNVTGKKAWTEAPVKLSNRGATVTASSMNLDLERGSITFSGDVEAVLKKNIIK